MDEKHNEERGAATCPNCGAEIDYKAEAGSDGTSGCMRCPSCGNEVETAGSDPKLEGFGPGVGQSGA